MLLIINLINMTNQIQLQKAAIFFCKLPIIVIITIYIEYNIFLK